ncbi:uncharacterized protein LOC127285796 [Leptopilina boulardi]|uniref:uncharacterized protein LOC127285796 n=1 Tax=Leptopilina boulardi TaxID=63433 RepID=UPI0021F62BCB|nr:uncharacterized protein LOC127285796 [Leptopilina boulardi]
MSCFVKGCTTSGYMKKNCNENYKKHLFSPVSEEILCEWKKAIPGGENLLKKHRICELHFEKDDIITDFVTKMPDGSEYRLKRERPMLRKGAIPKFFSTLTCKETYEASQKEIEKNHQKNVIKNNESFLLLKGEEVDFKEMMNFSDKIPLPSKNWFVNSVEKFIQWTSYSYNFDDCSKIVRVNDDKTVNILLGRKKVEIPNFQTVNNVNDVVALLKEVDKVIPCGETERSDKCFGFIIQKESSRGRKFIFCEECAKHRKRMQNKIEVADIIAKLRMKNKKLREKCKNAKRKELRLVKTRKVLKRKIQELRGKHAETKEEILN